MIYDYHVCTLHIAVTEFKNPINPVLSYLNYFKGGGTMLLIIFIVKFVLYLTLYLLYNIISMVFDFVVCFEVIPHSNAELLKWQHTTQRYVFLRTLLRQRLVTSYLPSIVTLDLYPTKKIWSNYYCFWNMIVILMLSSNFRNQASA